MTRTKDDVEREVISLLKDGCDLTVDVSLGDSLTDGCLIDSIDGISFIMGLEDYYDIEIPDEDLKVDICVSDVVDYIWEKVKEEED